MIWEYPAIKVSACPVASSPSTHSNATLGLLDNSRQQKTDGVLRPRKNDISSLNREPTCPHECESTGIRRQARLITPTFMRRVANFWSGSTLSTERCIKLRISHATSLIIWNTRNTVQMLWCPLRKLILALLTTSSSTSLVDNSTCRARLSLVVFPAHLKFVSSPGGL